MDFVTLQILLTVTTSTGAILSQEPIVQIIENNYPNCSLILTYDNEESALTSIVQSIKSSLTNRDSYLINFQTFNNPRALTENHGALSKLRENCVISLISIDEEPGEETFLKLGRLLIPRNLEISKMDEDFYLILTRWKWRKRILGSKEFAMKIKNKLLMATGENEELEFITTCFYCNYGSFGLIELPVESGLLVPKNLFPNLNRNFNAHQLRVVVATGTHSQARIMPDMDRPGSWKPMRGSYFSVLDQLREIFNFTYRVSPSRGGGTGLLLPNGTWIGTAGDVYNNDADLGMVTAVTYQRYRYVGYSYPLSWEWLTFATAQEAPTFSWQAIFWPLSSLLWLSVGGTLLLLSIILFIFYRILRRVGEPRHAWTSGEFVFGTFLDQSLTMPKRGTLRLIVALLMVLSLVIGTGYRSKLVTALAFPSKEKTPATFQELAESGYAVGLCYVGGAAYAVFKSSTNPTYIKLSSIMKLHTDMTDCFVSTQLEKKGCIGYDSMANYVLAKNLTDRRGRKLIVVTPASTFFVAIGMVVRKRWVSRLDFDRYIMSWDDMAIITKWRQMDYEAVRQARVRWEDESGTEGPMAEVHEGPRVLAIANFKAVFFLLLLGIILGCLSFIGEIYMGKQSKSRNIIK